MSSLYGFVFTTQEGRTLTVTSDPAPTLDTYVTVEDVDGNESLRLRSLVQARRDFDARDGRAGLHVLRSTPTKRRKRMARTRTKPNTTSTTPNVAAKEPKTSKMAVGAPILIELLDKADGNEMAMTEIRKAIDGTAFPKNKSGFYIAEVMDWINDNIDGVGITKPKRGYLKLAKKS